MLQTYFELDEYEIINSARTYAYAKNADCAITAVRHSDRHDCLQEALEHSDYIDPLSDDAPWIDIDDVDSDDFLGLWPIEVTGLSDSTYQAESVEAILDGGTVGSPRKAGRALRFNVALVATTMAGIEYGHSWLSSVLSGISCLSPVDDCGEAVLGFFVDCPEIDNALPIPAQVDPYRRFLHRVRMTEGPVEIETRKVRGGWVRTVVFHLYAGTPQIYGVSRPIALGELDTEYILDNPRNIFKYPSAELTSGSVVVKQNLVTNPSLETAVTGWSFATIVGTGLGTVTGARSSADAAQGSWSYRVTIPKTGAGSPIVRGLSSAAAATAGRAYSGSVWGKTTIDSGSPTVVSGTPVLLFLNSGGTILQAVYGTPVADLSSGEVMSVPSTIAPANTTQAKIGVEVELAGGTGTVSCFVDIALISNP